MGQVTLISGRERRRRWSLEERARILAATRVPGAVVAEVARREDICTSLVYKWRREARDSIIFLKVDGFSERNTHDLLLKTTRNNGIGVINENPRY